jgi:hypothetical protein
MKITGIEVTELRVPGWDAQSFDGSYDNCLDGRVPVPPAQGLVRLNPETVQRYRVASDRSARYGNGRG